MTITSQLKNLASPNGTISLEKALALAAGFDKERSETLLLLKRIEPEVGMVLGESINVHMAGMEGKRFNSVEYHYEPMPGNQKV